MTWVLFACAGVRFGVRDVESCAKFADAMLAEMNSRDLNNDNEVAIYTDDDIGNVTVNFSGVHTNSNDVLQVSVESMP